VVAPRFPDPGLDHLLRTAIDQTRLISFFYKGKLRIVEPHDYGVHNRVIKLLTWQVGGSSDGPLPSWRWIEVEGMSGGEMLYQTFPGGRPPQSGKHHQWDQLFARVKAAPMRKSE
jgi:hypothetical protein